LNTGSFTIMKILHLANHCHRVGNGIVNVAVDLACSQSAEGHHVAFVSARGEYIELLAQYGVQHFDVDKKSREVWKLIEAAGRFLVVFRQFQPDIVHAHMITGALLAKAFKPWFNYRLVTTVHNEFQRSASLMGVGDCVVAVSAAVASALIKRGFSAGKVRVVRNGSLGTPRLASLSADVPSLSHPSIVTVAGLNHRKGISDLIEAFEIVARRNADAHLYIVGDGPQRAEFEAQARRSFAARRIVFAGFVADPRGYLREADVFVLASHRDPFPLVLMEAREAGCAVIATRVDGVPEALDGGQAGILVPPCRSDVLGSTLADLLDREDELRVWRERSLRNLEPFSLARATREYLAVYKEVLAPTLPR
jgi:glycosyltransferase involved in cell wall biosynthesis